MNAWLRQRWVVGLVGLMVVASGGATESGDATSPDMKAEIRAGLPAFGQSAKAPAPARASDPPELQMAAHIKRLPQKQFEPPKGEEVLTEKGKAEAAMNEYLGKPDGFDRGFLNRFTLPDLWNKVPLLKYLPCPLPGITNEARAEAIKSDLDFHQAARDEADFGSLDKLEDAALLPAGPEGK